MPSLPGTLKERRRIVPRLGLGAVRWAHDFEETEMSAVEGERPVNVVDDVAMTPAMSEAFPK